MKKFVGIGLIAALSIALFSCGASKAKAQEHPFKVLEATYANRVGEQPDLVETTVKISIDNKEIQLDTVYFRNHKAPLKLMDSTKNSIFSGSFITSTILHDFILHSDPKQEFGNKPPVTVSKLPFELANNEAVVSYFYKNKINYYKISEVKEE
ncbi:MAG: hypothetical protein Q7U59_03910 [Lutibacter sp.]|nr:hypothetical protein [Lutibacter sp.]MDP3358090.1 hypothetical protein [Lutibacter sp.]